MDAGKRRSRQGQGKEKARRAQALDTELRVLREAFEQAREAMMSGEEDMARAGTLLARLGDSVIKTVVAQERLAANAGQKARLEEEYDSALRALGFGEE